MKDENDEGIISKLRYIAMKKKQDKFIEDAQKIEEERKISERE